MTSSAMPTVSTDLKRAAVRMHLSYRLSAQLVSDYLGIHRATVYRAVEQFQLTGDAIPHEPRNKGGRPPILDEWDLSVSSSYQFIRNPY
jgi:transposase